MEDIEQVLATEIDAQGRKFEVHNIHEPSMDVFGTDCEPQATYFNFLFVNGGLIVPRFGDESADSSAVEVLKSLVPDRRVKQVYINALPLCGGGIHCVTQQIEA